MSAKRPSELALSLEEVPPIPEVPAEGDREEIVAKVSGGGDTMGDEVRILVNARFTQRMTT